MTTALPIALLSAHATEGFPAPLSPMVKMHSRCDLACDHCYMKVGISIDGDRASNDLQL